MERLTLNLKHSEVEVPPEPSPSYLVANVGEAARGPALELASRIRRAGVGAILSSGSRALRGQMRQANALGIPYVAILGDDEIARGRGGDPGYENLHAGGPTPDRILGGIVSLALGTYR